MPKPPKHLSRRILKFYERCKNDEHHRYRSWEHCFSYFRNRRKLEANLDTAALHLAFYLASWGMYRGSSALLWKDYKIHELALTVLLEKKYNPLWNLKFDARFEDEAIGLILELSRTLKEKYHAQIKTVNGKRRNFQPTEILVTKVLLGTMACTPACDRFFIVGFRRQGWGYSKFGENFLRKVFRFYRENKHALVKTQRQIYSHSHVRYPMMKLIDMYFWELGSRAKL